MEDYSSYLLPHISACKGDHRCFGLRQALLRNHKRYRLRQGLGGFRFFGLRQGPGWCVFKLGSSFARIEKMPHCFLVDHSVFFIPREDEALPSIHILLMELWSHLPSHPGRDDRPRFFVFISVITISAYHDQHVIILSKNRMKMKNRQSYEICREKTFDFGRHTDPKYIFSEKFPSWTCTFDDENCSRKYFVTVVQTSLSRKRVLCFARHCAACVTWLRAILKSKVLQGCLHLYIPYPSKLFSIRHIFH